MPDNKKPHGETLYRIKPLEWQMTHVCERAPRRGGGRVAVGG